MYACVVQVGMKYAIFAPVVTAEELADTRHRFQRNASLLFSVLATTRARARIDTHTYSKNTLTSPTRSYSKNTLNSPTRSHALSQVLKTSQTHTTPVLSQLLLRMDYNQFFERTSQQRALSVRKDI